MESEGVRQAQQREPGEGGAAVPLPEQVARDFREALARCVEDEDEAGRLNAQMPRLGTLLGKETAAQLLREALARRGIAGAEDAQGRCCRSAAVEALLALGHPHALTVTPEDLDWYRAEGRRLPWGTQGMLGLALLAAANEAWELVPRAARQVLAATANRPGADTVDWEWPLAAALHGLLLLGVVGIVMGSPARTRRGRAWQAGLLVTGFLGGAVAAFGRDMGPVWLCAGVTLTAAVTALLSHQEREG